MRACVIVQSRDHVIVGVFARVIDCEEIMLPEQHATSYSSDPASGTVVIVSDSGSRPGLHGDVPARLLLDAGGHLVGVDLAPSSPDRLVVMLGPHESVARVEDAVQVHVDRGGRTVTLHGVAAKLIAKGHSPYVP